MIAQSNKDLGHVIAKSNKEYAEKLKEISEAEIKSKNRVDITLEEYETMKKVLNPEKIFVYGREVDEIEDDVEYIQTFTRKRFDE